jgi:hypothetical protein
MAKAAAKSNGDKSRRKPATDHGPAPFREHATPRFESTLDWMIMKLRGGIRQAVIMADYGPLRDKRTEAVLKNFMAAKNPIQFKLEATCEQYGLKPSEFVGMVVAGMSKFRLDYEELIRAQELPELLEKSFEFAKENVISGWMDRHELLKAGGAHLAPAKANIIIDNRDQSQTAHISGMPTFEETLGPMEAIGQRRLPESSAVEVEVKDVEFAAVER